VDNRSQEPACDPAPAGKVQLRAGANDAAKDGLWVINKTRQVIYAKSSLSIRDKLGTAANLHAGKRV
jgi:hypothetical protein